MENYPVRNFLFKDNSVVVLFNDKIGEYSLTDGTYICDRYFSDTGCGEFTAFVSRFTFMHLGGVFIPLWEAYSDKTCVLNNEKVYIVDGDMEATDEIEYKNLYLLYWMGDEYRFMANGRKTVVTDSNGIEVARFECGSNVFVVGNILYEIKDNVLREIDISSFFPCGNNRMETDAAFTETGDVIEGAPMGVKQAS